MRRKMERRAGKNQPRRLLRRRGFWCGTAWGLLALGLVFSSGTPGAEALAREAAAPKEEADSGAREAEAGTGKKDSAVSRAGNGDSQDQQAVTGKIRFSWWGNDVRHFYTMEGVDLFQEQNPGIEVEYRYGIWSGYEKRMKVFMESGTEADVMQINYAWLDTYSPEGEGYYDLYELADYIDLDNFTEDDLKFGEVEGKLNALPIALNTMTIYYNADILERYGLEAPTDWDGLFEAGAVLKEDGLCLLGMPRKQAFLLLLSWWEQAMGKPVFGEDGSFRLDEGEMAEMLEYYKKLIDGGVLMPIDQFGRTKFTEGAVAGSMFWISDAGSYCSALEDAGGTPVLGDYPCEPGAGSLGWYVKPATMYAISADTEYPEASACLLNFLMNSPEMADLQKTEKGVPLSKAALAEMEAQGYLDTYEYEATQQMLSEREGMSIMIPAMENSEIVDAFKENSDGYLYGEQSLEDCAAAIVQRIGEILG